jgi:hypothetical protein
LPFGSQAAEKEFTIGSETAWMDFVWLSQIRTCVNSFVIGAEYAR